jgi:hypothetical protein
VARNKKNRNRAAPAREFCLQFKPAHSRHPKIEHEAPRPLLIIPLEKAFRGLKHRDLEPLKLEKKPPGIPDRLFIIHNPYN